MTAPPADDDPITLAEACEIVFRNRIKVSTLRRETRRGNLVTIRVGRRDFTTLRDVREMIQRCRDADPAPRLYLDPRRKHWIVRDGSEFIRTGCPESDRRGAEKQLAEYIGRKHQPERGPSPLIADMLVVYAREHIPSTIGTVNTAYNLASLGAWWNGKRLSDVTPANCKAYGAGRTQSSARRDLEVLRASINYWHRHYGPLPAVPAVILPPKSVPRDRWLSRSEAARLLWAARRTQLLARFILLGLYTGSRSSVILGLTWEQIDLGAGVMYRRGRRILTHLRRWQRLDGGKAKYLCHYSGKMVSEMHSAWPNAIARSGLDDAVTPHTLRHTRATWLMRAGIDPWEAASSLGMTIQMMSAVYGHHHPDFQKRAAEV
jgi:integrase